MHINVIASKIGKGGLFMKTKYWKRFIAITLVGTMFWSVPVHAQTYDRTFFTTYIVENHFSSYDDDILNDMIQEYDLTEEEVTKIDQLIEKELDKPQTRSAVATVAAVVGIVAGVVAIMGATYEAGRYAARQCEVRLGLTASQYQENRWRYRLALAELVFAGGITGATVALGFDDYFMGV